MSTNDRDLALVLREKVTDLLYNSSYRIDR